MANSILGAGIFGLPSLIVARLDGYSPLSCLIAGCGAVIIAACIAEISSRFEKTGGLYLYGREAFGRFAGLLIAWLMLLTRIAAPAAAADLFANYLRQFIPLLRGKLSEVIVVGVLIGHLAILNYVGVKTGKTVSNIFSAMKVGMLVLFIAGGLIALELRPELRVPLHFTPTTAEGWFEALLLLVFGYGGFEGALISTYGYLSANLLHSARIPFSLAEQGDFPSAFARIHERFRTPHFSIAGYSLVLFVFAALGDFRWNAVLSAATRLVVYGMMAVALIVMRKQNGPAPFRLPAGIAFSAMSMAIVLALLGHIGQGEAAVLGLTAIGALANWAVLKQRRGT